MASVALRFVFPAVSLEGRSWWALRSAPLSLWEILWSKFLGGVAPIAVLGVVLVGVSNHFLGVDPFVTRLSNLTVLVMAVTLAGMGVGFGVEWRWVVRYESRGVREEIPDQMTKSPSAMYLANILRTEAVSLVAYTVKPRSISALKASCP